MADGGGEYMNILLMSVKAGFGHHSTAAAIINYFEKYGHTCYMLDIFEYISESLGNMIQDGYLISTKYLSKTYGKVYDKLSRKDEPYDRLSVTSLVSNKITKKLIGCVRNFEPDIIIGTHSYAGVVMSILRDKGVADCPLIGIVTDFTVHPFWESTELDYYVIPDSLLTYQMNKKGISKEKLLPFGIPIKQAFASKLDKKEARERLGVENKRTLLVMMGSMGYGNIYDTLLEIDDFSADFQMIIICGSNEKLLHAVNEHEWQKKVYGYGFVGNVDLMMDASDIIVTKPGGLTTSEAFAKGLPMIAMNPIPGQEDKNLAFLVNNGAAIAVNSEYTISEALYQLFNEDWRVELMRTSVGHIGKPDSTKRLYDFVMSLPGTEAAGNKYAVSSLQK